MRFLALIVLLLAAFFSVAYSATPNTVIHFYSTDTSTRLFDNFEGTSLADSRSASAIFASGYLEGQALYLSDTGAHAIYSDSWWQDNGSGYQESGTIEFYYRPDSTYIFTGAKPHGMLLTMGERPNPPAVGGLPQLSVFENGLPRWAISRNSFGQLYFEASGNEPLNPEQWYHIAATWGDGEVRLYRNDTLVASASADSFVVADTFRIGATGLIPSALGSAARGRIDRLRISNRIRTISEFPRAMEVEINSPTEGTVSPPFPITFCASASETRTKLVDVYADTDEQNFNGTLLVRDLPESGTFLVGSGLAAGDYFFYLVAHAGGDSAWVYTPQLITVAITSGYGAVVDPADTTAAIELTPTTTDSFTVVLLNLGDTTSGSLVASADSAGTNADHIISTRLMNATDTARFSIWMRDTNGAILFSVRSDTASLNVGGLPLRITNTPAALNAFGATVIAVEFLDAGGVIIGDTQSTTFIGDRYAYTIEYQLSAATTQAFYNLGIDTSVGSTAFGFYYADTYGARWIEDAGVTISVVAGSNGGINVRVAGITKDLPGGLGATALPSRTAQSSEPDWCLLRAAGTPNWLLDFLRAIRDLMLQSIFGRYLTAAYYSL